MTREELEAGYEAPYRRWLPRLYALNRVRELVLLAVVLWVLAALGVVSAAVAGAATVVAGVWALWTTAAGAWVIARRTGEWRTELSELDRVRASRPHAADADPRSVHDEYAVAVADDAALVTWRFRPLAAWEAPKGGETLVRGRPRYAAWVVARTTHDTSDAAVAAEQLATAQAAAAARERTAAESASTGAALREVTGQAPR